MTLDCLFLSAGQTLLSCCQTDEAPIAELRSPPAERSDWQLDLPSSAASLQAQNSYTILLHRDNPSTNFTFSNLKGTHLVRSCHCLSLKATLHSLDTTGSQALTICRDTSSAAMRQETSQGSLDSGASATSATTGTIHDACDINNTLAACICSVYCPMHTKHVQADLNRA